ncbi:MAG TPA: hypothetical protein VMH80_12325 [Bryobacteraceae bacterium]|nr:hypothetical protein [Bryobacteraceae bacterium]
MNNFYVYLKEQKSPILVKAEDATEKDGFLIFVVGSETVAKFALAEVQGWNKGSPSRK